MQGDILSETEAFTTKQRDSLLKRREELVQQQQDPQRQKELDAMLEKFDVFQGKLGRRQTRGASRRRGPRREEVLQVIKQGNGLTRGEILEEMGLKATSPARRRSACPDGAYEIKASYS